METQWKCAPYIPLCPCLMPNPTLSWQLLTKIDINFAPKSLVHTFQSLVGIY